MPTLRVHLLLIKPKQLIIKGYYKITLNKYILLCIQSYNNNFEIFAYIL